jgi:hypothetical protein
VRPSSFSRLVSFTQHTDTHTSAPVLSLRSPQSWLFILYLSIYLSISSHPPSCALSFLLFSCCLALPPCLLLAPADPSTRRAISWSSSITTRWNLPSSSSARAWMRSIWRITSTPSARRSPGTYAVMKIGRTRPRRGHSRLLISPRPLFNESDLFAMTFFCAFLTPLSAQRQAGPAILVPAAARRQRH